MCEIARADFKIEPTKLHLLFGTCGVYGSRGHKYFHTHPAGKCLLGNSRDGMSDFVRTTDTCKITKTTSFVFTIQLACPGPKGSKRTFFVLCTIIYTRKTDHLFINGYTHGTLGARYVHTLRVACAYRRGDARCSS